MKLAGNNVAIAPSLMMFHCCRRMVILKRDAQQFDEIAAGSVSATCAHTNRNLFKITYSFHSGHGAHIAIEIPGAPAARSAAMQWK